VTGLVQSIITIVLFFLILGSLVVIHELGHFITARLANVRVLEFGIGFPPRAKVLRNRGETLYSLNWLPIGGFVKLEGEDGDSADDPRSFAAQRLIVKLGILVAGVVMNVFLAFAIFTSIALIGVPTVGVSIGSVQADSPAAQVGLQAGDSIVAIDGTHYAAFDRVPGRPTSNAFDLILADLAAHAGQTVELGVQHADGSTSTATATLRDAEAVAAGKGALGISTLSAAVTETTRNYTLTEAVAFGAKQTVDALGLIVNGLGQLADAIVNRPTEAPPVSGPVGIATQIGDVFWQLGPLFTLYVAGILSANLAVVNVLPFPPLDGGRMLVIVLKRLFGARISLQAERLTYLVGFVFLFVFLIWVTGFDIIRGLGGGT
jgi:regulator of sigma E protease